MHSTKNQILKSIDLRTLNPKCLQMYKLNELNKIKTIDTWSLKLSLSMGAKGTTDFNQ